MRRLLVLGLVAASLAVSPAAATDAPLRGRTVVLDPGHNPGNFAHPAEIARLVDAGTLRKPCDTTGTAAASGYTEAAFTWDVSRRAAAILRRWGAHVVLTRGASSPAWGPCITKRAAIGNRARADAAVSVHADGGPSAGRGFHVIYPPSIRGLTDDIAARSRRLALALRSAYLGATGVPYSDYAGDGALSVRSDLGGLNLSDVPKVFLEAGNMRNAADAALLASPRFRQRAAVGIASGVRAYLRSG